ncbi:MAG: hypothetical protein P8R00_07125 [Candidatus Poseidoniaceae archaeon]|nr:hypothetical protein [Candidatus Poseidoniaceae archaeon]
MQIEFVTDVVVPVLISLLLISYVGYCWFNQKVHVRGKGWKTRDEYPKNFYFTLIVLTIIGIGQLASIVYFYVLK